MEQNRLSDFEKRYYEEHYCEIILNLDERFRGSCRLKYLLSRAMAVILFSGVEPY